MLGQSSNVMQPDGVRLGGDRHAANETKNQKSQNDSSAKVKHAYVLYYRTPENNPTVINRVFPDMKL